MGSYDPEFLALCAASGVDPDSIPDRKPRLNRRRKVHFQRSADRARSRARRRSWGGSPALPPHLRALFTPGEGAVMAVLRDEVRRRGFCSLPNAKIAAIAGVCITLVKRAMRVARANGLIRVQTRRVERNRNLPNVVTIIASDWIDWIKCRRRAKGGGGTKVTATETHSSFNVWKAFSNRGKATDRKSEDIDDNALRRIRDRLGASGRAGPS